MLTVSSLSVIMVCGHKHLSDYKWICKYFNWANSSTSTQKRAFKHIESLSWKNSLLFSKSPTYRLGKNLNGSKRNANGGRSSICIPTSNRDHLKTSEPPSSAMTIADKWFYSRMWGFLYRSKLCPYLHPFLNL